MATQEPDYLMSAQGIAALTGAAASLVVGAAMYRWLFWGEEVEEMGVKPATSADVKTDIEASTSTPYSTKVGQEQAVLYTAQHAYPNQPNPYARPAQPIVGYPNPEPHIPSIIDVDEDGGDVSTLGEYTAGRSKIAPTFYYQAKMQGKTEFMPSTLEEPQARVFPQQGSVPPGTASQAKTWTSGQGGTLASSYKIPENSLAPSTSENKRGMDISYAQEYDLIGSVSASKPESGTGTTATMSQTSSSMGRSRGSGASPRVPSSRSSYASEPYSQVDIIAPSGKLGLILVNRSDGHLGTMVKNVREDSPLHNIVLNGDSIIAVNGEDVSFLSVEELTEILSKNMYKQRRLTVVTPIRSDV